MGGMTKTVIPLYNLEFSFRIPSPLLLNHLHGPFGGIPFISTLKTPINNVEQFAQSSQFLGLSDFHHGIAIMPSKADRKLIRAAPVEVRIRKAPPAILSELGQPAGLFRLEGQDYVFRTGLGEGHSISEHLVWLQGMLQGDYKGFRRALANGADIVLCLYSESREIALSPQAILLAHKLQAPIEIYCRQ